MTPEKKYITLENGVDFRSIAKIMTANSFRMNHATARNQLIIAMEKLLTHVASEINGHKSKNAGSAITIDLDALLKDSNVHEYLSDILFAAHTTQGDTNK